MSDAKLLQAAQAAAAKGEVAMELVVMLLTRPFFASDCGRPDRMTDTHGHVYVEAKRRSEKQRVDGHDTWLNDRGRYVP